jgi:hypothetical protein
VLLAQLGCASSSSPTANTPFVPKTFADSIVGNWLRIGGFCLIQNNANAGFVQRLTLSRDGKLCQYRNDTLNLSMNYRAVYDHAPYPMAGDSDHILLVTNDQYSSVYKYDCPFHIIPGITHVDSLYILNYYNDTLEILEDGADRFSSAYSRIK